MDKILVMPIAVDLEKFRPRDKILNSVVFVGRLSLEKNLSSLMEAMSTERWGELHVVGDGPLRSVLGGIQQRLCVPVQWHGAVPHEVLPALLGRMEYLVVPSLYDQAPKVIVEGMACGCLIIASYPLHHMVDDGITGYLCDPTGVGIATALRRVRDDPNREKARQAALEYVREHHGLQKVMEAEREVLRCLK